MDREDSSPTQKKRFRELAERDVLEEASEEERSLLRRDENLGLCREALVAISADLQRAFRGRKKRLNRARDHYHKEKSAESRAAYEKEQAEYNSWKLSALAYKVNVDEKLSENRELRRRRHYRWNVRRDPRELLRRSRDALSERASEEEITDQERELLADIEHLLGENDDGG